MSSGCLSFQQLKSDLAQPSLQHWVGSDRGFGDDVPRYSLCGFDLTGLEAMLVQSNRTLKRGKAFDEGRVQARIVAALDCIEVLSSYSGCCESCLDRRVTSRQGGVKVEQVQYYRRAVGCCPSAVHRAPRQHLDGFQLYPACLMPTTGDNPEDTVYFLSNFLLDGFGRLFPCGVSVSSMGRVWQISSFTATKDRLNCWYCRKAAISVSTFRCAAGLGKLSVTVLPLDLWVRRECGAWPGSLARWQ